jgi:hypothetical protein
MFGVASPANQPTRVLATLLAVVVVRLGHSRAILILNEVLVVGVLDAG